MNNAFRVEQLKKEFDITLFNLEQLVTQLKQLCNESGKHFNNDIETKVNAVIEQINKLAGEL